MTTSRLFCRLSKSSIHADTPAFGLTGVPAGGFCLSTFLVIAEHKLSGSVLMGRLNPEAPWDHIGALDRKRVEMFSKGWMLPSSHLILHESPAAAAERILKEQLEIESLPLSQPKIFSDLRDREDQKGERTQHWDIGFIFTGRLRERDLPRPRAWTELRFVDLNHTQRSQIVRSHEDVLEHAGLHLGRTSESDSH